MMPMALVPELFSDPEYNYQAVSRNMQFFWIYIAFTVQLQSRYDAKWTLIIK